MMRTATAAGRGRIGRRRTSNCTVRSDSSVSDAVTGRDEADLVDRATRDPDQFWALVKPYDPGLRALAYRVLDDRDVMDDVLQEAYVKAFVALPRLRGDATVGTWLYRIVYNACIDELRRAGRRRHVALDDAAHALDRGGADPADTAAARSDLAAALRTLPVGLRAAVLLVDAQGMDYRQAADVLKVPVGTVASRLNRARRLLRRALGTTVEGGGR
ncbi:MAG: sigma-70 family RNA polymerase sigma factor [Nitriliruptorales bacterium]|nr:sigma-70 family RNA polymerase sigma factor [Nitriliruptorales bacterium]